jgi:putative membrane protein
MQENSLDYVQLPRSRNRTSNPVVIHHYFNPKLLKMELLAEILIAVVAIEHCYILWLEMFGWTTRGPKVFKSLPKDLFIPTKTLAANQGLYNGFLAAGLLWSLLIQDHAWSFYVAIFFLSCVIIAGIYGGMTVGKRIFYVQAVPAILALIAAHL